MEKTSREIFIDRCQFCSKEFCGLTEKDAGRKKKGHETFCKPEPSTRKNE